jgi:SAM-dependent methyltransferase
MHRPNVAASPQRKPHSSLTAAPDGRRTIVKELSVGGNTETAHLHHEGNRRSAISTKALTRSKPLKDTRLYENDLLRTSVEQRQNKYYNTIAYKYDVHFMNQHALRYRKELYEDILRGVAVESMRVLDAACGGGENSAFFVEHGAAITGLDISEVQCAIFQRRFPNSTVVNASMADTGLENNSFDLVVTESLHHVHPFVNECVNEIHRILKPGGYFLLWEPVTGSIFDAARRLWYRHDPEFFQDNEASVDVVGLIETHKAQFKKIELRYGGNFGHLFVSNSMAFRIPPSVVKYYASPALLLERLLNRVTGRRLALWALCLLRKVELDRPCQSRLQDAAVHLARAFYDQKASYPAVAK